MKTNLRSRVAALAFSVVAPSAVVAQQPVQSGEIISADTFIRSFTSADAENRTAAVWYAVGVFDSGHSTVHCAQLPGSIAARVSVLHDTIALNLQRMASHPSVRGSADQYLASMFNTIDAWACPVTQASPSSP